MCDTYTSSSQDHLQTKDMSRILNVDVQKHAQQALSVLRERSNGKYVVTQITHTLVRPPSSIYSSRTWAFQKTPCIYKEPMYSKRNEEKDRL